MKIADIMQSLEIVRKSLSKNIQLDLIQSYAGNVISWGNYQPGIFRDQFYPLEYQWLIDNQQYSFLLSDGSFLQFYYEFDSTGLKSGRASFYPRPIPSRANPEDILEAAVASLEMDDQYSDYLLNIVEEIELTGIIPPNTSHVRFDYERSVKSHEPSHLQFGAINSLRIPSDFFPTPFAFVELVSGAMSNINLIIPTEALGHSAGKALRSLVCNKLINLNHLST